MSSAFGVVRGAAESSTVAPIYEFEYQPKRHNDFDPNLKGGHQRSQPHGDLRPSVRSGKAPFAYFGLQVPLSHAHARCWFGQSLIQEQRDGSFTRVEFVSREREAQPPVPLWQWHVWCPEDEQPVVVVMHLDAKKGIWIELKSHSIDAKARVYRILRQYCDDFTESHWKPIPDSQKKVTVLRHRDTPADPNSNPVVGSAPPQGVSTWLDDRIAAWRSSELDLQRSLARAHAVQAGASSSELMVICTDIKCAFRSCQQSSLRMKPEWLEWASPVFEKLLQRLLAEGHPEPLGRGIRLASEVCKEFNVSEPPSFHKAQAEARAIGVVVA